MTNQIDQHLTTTEWARQYGVEFAWRCAGDNYEPVPRVEHYGTGWFYDLDDERANGIVLDDVSELRDKGLGCVYLIDDGRTIEAYYIASWHPEGTHVILHPMPTNFDKHGNRRLRADDQRPVDFDTWMLGPRLAWHLKIKVVDAT